MTDVFQRAASARNLQKLQHPDRWSECPSTHCERRQECCSPHECCANLVKLQAKSAAAQKGAAHDHE